VDNTDFHALYERHAHDVLRFAWYLCADRALAEDIAAEVFARVWTRDEPVRVSTVKGYLFAIARNLLAQRARRARAESLAEATADRRPGPAALAGDRIELRAVLEALGRLPEADRAALLMRAQDGMSHEEIAAVLGQSVVATRVRIHRARLKLAQLTAREERKP
jgi:RNA polymerase sigma-70 factor (ECF subfamily)